MWELLCMLSIKLILKWGPFYDFLFIHPGYGIVISCAHFILKVRLYFKTEVEANVLGS